MAAAASGTFCSSRRAFLKSWKEDLGFDGGVGVARTGRWVWEGVGSGVGVGTGRGVGFGSGAGTRGNEGVSWGGVAVDSGVEVGGPVSIGVSLDVPIGVGVGVEPSRS